MPKGHLTRVERGQIQAFLSQGLSQRAIAHQLERHPSTICRELARNRPPSGPYDAVRAQARYERVRKRCRRATSLSYPPLRRYIIDKMTEGWSPEQVSQRLWHESPTDPRMHVSTETIYRSLYADEKLGRVLIGCLRRRHPRRWKRGARRPTRPFIPNRVSIEARPPQVDNRERYGDWEGDLMVGAQQQGAVLTLVERKSLLLRAALLPSRHAQGVAQAAIDRLGPMPDHWRRTITFDNGSEFAHHERIADDLDMDTYFAHPYAPYERGTNENTNGLLRQYLPKTTDFTQITERQLQRYVRQLNQRPRKKLQFRTPLELFNQQNVALDV